jgi:hypothetical protein
MPEHRALGAAIGLPSPYDGIAEFWVKKYVESVEGIFYAFLTAIRSSGMKTCSPSSQIPNTWPKYDQTRQ